MIIKAWVKFKDMDVECFCSGDRKAECGPDAGCEYCVVKFIPIPEEAEDLVGDAVSSLKITTKKVKREIDKLSKISKTTFNKIIK